MASRAGTVAQPQDLVDLTALLDAYYDVAPDLGDPGQRVVFGTSGHRGSSLKASFNEPHILAITQAIVEYRAGQGITGPLYLAKDTHALSEPAQNSALEVLAANGVNVLIDARHGYTPTPSLSHAILTHNNNSPAGAPQADGIVVTPSHNPPGDGGFKYNPPHGGPADSDATGWIANRANELLENGLRGVKRIPIADALNAGTTGKFDFLSSYVDDLPSVLDLNAIREAGVRIGADPMGGASVDYWSEIGERHHLNLTVVNPTVDPQWEPRMVAAGEAGEGLGAADGGLFGERVGGIALFEEVEFLNGLLEVAALKMDLADAEDPLRGFRGVGGVGDELPEEGNGFGGVVEGAEEGADGSLLEAFGEVELQGKDFVVVEHAGVAVDEPLQGVECQRIVAAFGLQVADQAEGFRSAGVIRPGFHKVAGMADGGAAAAAFGEVLDALPLGLGAFAGGPSQQAEGALRLKILLKSLPRRGLGCDRPEKQQAPDEKWRQ